MGGFFVCRFIIVDIYKCLVGELDSRPAGLIRKFVSEGNVSDPKITLWDEGLRFAWGNYKIPVKYNWFEIRTSN